MKNYLQSCNKICFLEFKINVLCEKEETLYDVLHFIQYGLGYEAYLSYYQRLCSYLLFITQCILSNFMSGCTFNQDDLCLCNEGSLVLNRLAFKNKLLLIVRYKIFDFHQRRFNDVFSTNYSHCSPFRSVFLARHDR